MQCLQVPSTSTLASHSDGQNAALGHSVFHGTTLGPLPYLQYPTYRYGMLFPPVPPNMPLPPVPPGIPLPPALPGMPGIAGTPGGYPHSHSQMLVLHYHPMLGFYYPLSFGNPPPSPMQWMYCSIIDEYYTTVYNVSCGAVPATQSVPPRVPSLFSCTPSSPSSPAASAPQQSSP